MQRRSFLQKTSLTGLAIDRTAATRFFKGLRILHFELMGKADIELYGEGFQLRKKAHDALWTMKKAAYGDGIDLKAVSSYRSFEHQRSIFERKYLRYTDEDGMKPIAAHR